MLPTCAKKPCGKFRGHDEGEDEGEGEALTHTRANRSSSVHKRTSEGGCAEGDHSVHEETKCDHRPCRLGRLKKRKVLHKSLVLSQDAFVGRVWEGFSATLHDKLEAMLLRADSGNFCRTCFAFLSEFCFWVCDVRRPLAKCGCDVGLEDASEVAVLLINMLARVVASKEGVPFQRVRNRALEVDLPKEFTGDRQTCARDKGFLGFFYGCAESILFQFTTQFDCNVCESDSRRRHRMRRLEMNAFGWMESLVSQVCQEELRDFVKAVHGVWDTMPMQDLRPSALSLAKFAMVQHIQANVHPNTHTLEGLHAYTFTCTCNTDGENGLHPCLVHFNLSLASSADLDTTLDIPMDITPNIQTEPESSISSIDMKPPFQAETKPCPMAALLEQAAQCKAEVLEYLSRRNLGRQSSRNSPHAPTNPFRTLRSNAHRQPTVSYEEFSSAALTYPDELLVLDCTGVFKPVCTRNSHASDDGSCIIT